MRWAEKTGKITFRAYPKRIRMPLHASKGQKVMGEDATVGMTLDDLGYDFCIIL